MAEKRLDHANVGPALEQVGCEAVAQGVQCHRLPDAGRVCRLMEQAVELAGGHWLATPDARKQPAFLWWYADVVPSWTRLPPLPQESEHLRRQHDVAILAPLGLHHADDALGAVDITHPEPDHLAGAQAAAVAEREQHASLERLCHCQQAPGLIGAHDERDLLRLFDVINLCRQVQAPQRHPEQELQPRHRAVAMTDGHSALSQVQLEPPDVVGGSGLGRSLQECREPLAGTDMALLRGRAELARAHVLQHALTERADGIGTHGRLLSEVDNTSILRARRPIADALSTRSQLTPTRPRSAGYRAAI